MKYNIDEKNVVFLMGASTFKLLIKYLTITAEVQFTHVKCNLCIRNTLLAPGNTDNHL